MHLARGRARSPGADGDAYARLPAYFSELVDVVAEVNVREQRRALEAARAARAAEAAEARRQAAAEAAEQAAALGKVVEEH